MAEPGPIVAPSLDALGLSRSRPLVIVDVDEVLGLFMQGFGKFLESRGYEFRVDRFALFQNIYRPGAAVHLELPLGRKLPEPAGSSPVRGPLAPRVFAACFARSWPF